ncbi:anthranilate synthase component I family protein [Flavobacterium sp. 14A]|uniref:anthranilate synthase component I family protein n=1 Tax=Flavobacterium sp. 14A TaxID=2735896 RepID=UPI00156EADA7|nr:anthranilate synthase component I family protein [Flavobacterium sp. 14A]NRT12448.1 para-aminobenzoate synthetase component 1 [Flavobacterium sp. 14A]
MRTSVYKQIHNLKQFKEQLLIWSQQYQEVSYLDSNEHKDSYSKYDCIVAVDGITAIKTDYHNAFEDLKQYQQTTKDWIFGFLSYDLKNDVEDLHSNNYDGLEFPDLFFFQPKKIFIFKEDTLEMRYLNMCDDEFESDFTEILNTNIFKEAATAPVTIQARISKKDYLDKVGKLLEHIHRGDCYEANFCMEFYAENSTINPLEKYFKLNEISKAPFAVYFKNQSHFLLSASPERYLKKEAEVLVSQPIKGTSRRYDDAVKDEESKLALATDPKERAENIMITDLVRNDLSHTAQKGAVQVTELCGLYSFLQVHQMISTITSKIDAQYSAIDTLKTTFPMGSMTGAPKVSVMKIIEDLEETKRGLYSGAVGYFTPEGDYDFNVVIRSILYNQKKKYISFSVGSAITARSNPEMEYQECMLKAKAMREVLA